MVDRKHTHCRLLRIQLLAALFLLIAEPAFSQTLPNDRQSDGLKGSVHVVVETNIGRKPQTDTIHRKSTHWIVVQDTQQVFLLFKKVKPRRVKVDTMVIEPTTHWVPDTIYYCRTEYTPEGFLKSRFLVKDHGKEHEMTTTTFQNNCKLEMRTYCQEEDVTTQWHYYYSDYGKEPQLEQIVVTQYRGHESGKMVERIEFEYISEVETCRERHISLSGEMSKSLKYESGLLTDMACGQDGQDTNIHYRYDAEGRLIEVEVYNTDFDLIRSDKYEYSPTGVRLTSMSAAPKQGRQIFPETIAYDEEYDGAGNWTQRTIDGKDTRKREIKYYNR